MTVQQDSSENQACNTALPVDPFTALKPHFGMLLGVADFQTIDAYHRGKQWMHNAWLHRRGVVWGFKVSLSYEHNEIRVSPGLAIDGMGRELHLKQSVCLNLPAWLETHKGEPILIDNSELDGNQLTLNAHIRIQFRACLARQVPALMEPCEGGGASSAYSRILETVEVELVPGLAPELGESGREQPFHGLRLLFNLEGPIEEDSAVIESDQSILQIKEDILALDAVDQPKAYLLALRQIAALETMEMRPAINDVGEEISRFPEGDDAFLILANLSDLVVEETNFVSGEVDNSIRDAHIATSTIQELLCGPLFNAMAAEVADAGEDDELESESAELLVDAGGPRIDPDDVELNDTTLLISHSGPRLLARSISLGNSVFLSRYDINDGWASVEADEIDYDSSSKTIRANLMTPPTGELLRIIIKGTGEQPVLATRADSVRLPLAGHVDGASTSEHEGHDFVHMIKLEN